VPDPHWQLTSIFGGLDSDDYRSACGEIARRTSALEALLDQRGIGSGPPVPVNDDASVLLERLIEEFNALLEVLQTVSTYLTGFTAVDAFDDRGQAEASKHRAATARFRAIEARVTAWLGRFDPDSLIARSEVAMAHVHYLRRRAHVSRYQLGDEAEALAAALDESGGAAWERLHDDLVAKAGIDLTLPGETSSRTLTLAELFNLQADADRTVRAAAYHAETELLERFDVAHAAAMNGIKGQVRTLAAKRGWSHVLEFATFEQGIDAAVLGAMQEAVVDAFPVLRRYLRAKARALGLERLAWYDRRAPLPGWSEQRFDWPSGSAFVIERFAGYSPRLAEFARRAIEEGWIDVPPRRGKSNGAFCASVPLRGESRVLLNWGGTLDDVTTLAHELGHGYHNDAVHRLGRTPLQARKPMTLAETASMFCEALVVEAMLRDGDDSLRLAVLEQSLQGAAAITVDIHSRFLFEREVFDRRAGRELSVAELDAIMLEAQEATYGDGLDPELRFAKAWAEKPHYYSSTLSFYNFPYTFGYLFGLGLYARYTADPGAFRDRYDELLASTGMDTVPALAKRMGIDVQDPAFWRQGLAIVEAQVDEFETMTEA
jgi:oligoendopeptidase F